MAKKTSDLFITLSIKNWQKIVLFSSSYLFGGLGEKGVYHKPFTETYDEQKKSYIFSENSLLF